MLVFPTHPSPNKTTFTLIACPPPPDLVAMPKLQLRFIISLMITEKAGLLENASFYVYTDQFPSTVRIDKNQISHDYYSLI